VKTLSVLVLLGLFATVPSDNVMAQTAQAVALTRAKETALKDALFQIRNAIDRYYADKNQYPKSLDSLKTAKYIGRIPADPFINSASSWRVVLSRPDRNHPAGIYDVKSRSTAKALDGTKYSDW
jgi:general secretion pathway protein G